MFLKALKFAFEHRHTINSLIAWRREIRCGIAVLFHFASVAIKPKEKEIDKDYLFVF